MKGKVAIVTGSSSGIGAGIAQHLSGLGARVTITGRREQLLRNTRDKCVEHGAVRENILIVPGDVTDMSFLDKLISATISEFGKLDYLINNAGVAVWKGLTVTSEEDYDLMMTTNVKAPTFLTQKAVPHLEKTKGCIINISSALTSRPKDILTVYSMTKAAVDCMTKALASDLATYGIRVISVCLGLVTTSLIPAAIQTYADEHPGVLNVVGRLGEVDEVAKLVAILCDPTTGGFITGSCLVVDGGFTAMSENLPGAEALVKKVLGHNETC